MTPTRTPLSSQQRGIAVLAATLLVAGTVYLSMNFSLAPLIIVGVPGAFAYLLWYTAGLRTPLDPRIVIPPFLLATVGFVFHAIEEYLGHYGPAVGRIFGFAWTDQAFVVIVLALAGTLGLVAAGVHHRLPLAGLVATVFLATRLAELALFVFPLLRPAIAPTTPTPVSQIIDGTLVQNMPNHYIHTVNGYYFPGMLTVALPIVPALYALYRIWIHRHPAHHEYGAELVRHAGSTG